MEPSNSLANFIGFGGASYSRVKSEGQWIDKATRQRYVAHWGLFSGHV